VAVGRYRRFMAGFLKWMGLRWAGAGTATKNRL
jgi:hypothetical protein